MPALIRSPASAGGPRQEDDEFLATAATEATEAIRRTQRRAAGLRHGLQHLVAGVVAVTVVDLSEIVDVEEDDRHGGVGALGALELALRELDECAG